MQSNEYTAHYPFFLVLLPLPGPQYLRKNCKCIGGHQALNPTQQEFTVQGGAKAIAEPSLAHTSSVRLAVLDAASHSEGTASGSGAKVIWP